MSDPNQNQPLESTPTHLQEQEIEVVAEAEASIKPNSALVKEETTSVGQGESLGESRASWEDRNQERELMEALETHDLRKGYTGYLILLTCLWLIAVLLFVFMAGFRGAIVINVPQPILLSLNLTDEECAVCWRLYF